MARRSSNLLGDFLLALLALVGLGAGVVYVSKREGIPLPALPKLPSWVPTKLPSKEQILKYAPYAPIVPFAPFAFPLVPLVAPFAVAAYASATDFVKRMQSALTQAGFSTQGVDGVWGGHTSAAAAGFQSANGMVPTGLPEPPLANALKVPLPTVPSSLGSNFVQMIAGQLQGIVQNPLDAVKLMLHESGLDPSATYRMSDGTPVATGIFQLRVKSVPSVTGMSVAAFNALSAAAQIPFAAKSWRQEAATMGARLPLSGRDLYWLNFTPATYVAGAPDSYVIVKNNDTYLNASTKKWVPLKGVYTLNANLDHGGKGFITAGDMALALNDGAHGSPLLYAALANALQGAVA